MPASRGGYAGTKPKRPRAHHTTVAVFALGLLESREHRARGGAPLFTHFRSSLEGPGGGASVARSDLAAHLEPRGVGASRAAVATGTCLCDVELIELCGDTRSCRRPGPTSPYMSTSHKRRSVASGAPRSTRREGLCPSYPPKGMSIRVRMFRAPPPTWAHMSTSHDG